MGDYSSIEIGMLAGTVIGGLLALLGFLGTGSALFLLVTVVGAFTGIAAGRLIEKNKSVNVKR